MESGLWKYLSFILALYLLFIFPLIHTLERQEDIAYQLAYNEVSLFTDSVRERGHLNEEMVSGFLAKLSDSGYQFTVELVHMHQLFIPVYLDSSDPSTFTGQYQRAEEGFFTKDILDVIYTDPSSGKGDGVYRMKKGDMFQVAVTSHTVTLASSLKQLVLLQEVNQPVIIRLGGMIHNETN